MRDRLNDFTVDSGYDREPSINDLFSNFLATADETMRSLHRIIWIRDRLDRLHTNTYFDVDSDYESSTESSSTSSFASVHGPGETRAFRGFRTTDFVNGLLEPVSDNLTIHSDSALPSESTASSHTSPMIDSGSITPVEPAYPYVPEYSADSASDYFFASVFSAVTGYISAVDRFLKSSWNWTAADFAGETGAELDGRPVETGNFQTQPSITVTPASNHGRPRQPFERFPRRSRRPRYSRGFRRIIFRFFVFCLFVCLLFFLFLVLYAAIEGMYI